MGEHGVLFKVPLVLTFPRGLNLETKPRQHKVLEPTGWQVIQGPPAFGGKLKIDNHQIRTVRVGANQDFVAVGRKPHHHQAWIFKNRVAHRASYLSRFSQD